jgi:hypothetical protein
MILFACALNARAQSVAGEVAAAREAIVREDYEAAIDALDAADDRAPSEDSPIAAPVLAGIPYLRGIVLVRQGDPDGEAIDRWRETLAIQNDLPWDTSLVPNGEERALFEALRKEVEDRDAVDVGVPPATGLARLYVDGRRVRSGDTAIAGRHLAQITCPDGVTRGRWTDFDKPVRWFKLCPGGVDTTVVAADEETGGDDLGLLPVWKDETDPVVEGSPPPEPTSSVAQIERGGPSRPAVLASGGALVAVGVALDLFWVGPTYRRVEDARSDPETITRAEADDRTTSFQAARWTTLGVLGAGVAVAGTGLFLPVRPTGLGLAFDGVW